MLDSDGQIAELKGPQSKIDFISQTGDARIVFDQKMYLEDIFANTTNLPLIMSTEIKIGAGS